MTLEIPVHRYSVMYQCRRLSTHREVVRIVAATSEEAISKASSVMERNGFSLTRYKRPKAIRDL